MERERDTSAFLRHESCPECGSRDNLARYASGRGWCHGCGHFEPPDDDNYTPTPRAPRVFNPIPGEIVPIASSYGIDEKTCRALGIKIVQFSCKDPDGDPLPRKGCLSFDYHNAKGELWGQKVRYKISENEKTYSFPHADGKPPLWLMHKWGPGCDTRNLVVWEGEGDCSAYYQLTGGKYPTVSLPTGAKGSCDVLRDHYDFLDRFDKVVLIFDGDETGRDWATKAAACLPPGKAFIGEVHGHKDARTALMAGDGKAITSAFFNAREYKPEGIFTIADLKEDAIKPVEMGIPWWTPELTKWTYGRRWGETYLLGAGAGVGKTDFCTQSICYDALTLGLMTGVIYLEQTPVETVKRVAGKRAGKAFHIPMEEGGYTQAELEASIEELDASGKFLFGGNFSASAWPDIRSRIRYMVVSKGCQVIYLDNLTALIDPSNERSSVETIVKEISLLAQELGIIIIVVSHLATPEGKPHEEGGRVMLKHFKGSRAIAAWFHYAFGIERNTQAEDPEMRQYSTFRCVKDRYTGRANGKTMCFRFVPDTAQLVESEFPADPEAQKPASGPWKPTDLDDLDDDVPF